MTTVSMKKTSLIFRSALTCCVRHQAWNFRLLTRLLAQMERILEVKGLHEITKAVVETARETLVIGEARRLMTLHLATLRVLSVRQDLKANNMLDLSRI